ncbi:MAG TPA: hypothetical protein VGR91_17250 [Stellaceae bacterium]|nr:hypothetical protein [Stellaceae bacterium]
MNLVAYLLARLKEPSTAAGIGLFLATLGIHVPEPTLNAAAQLLTALLGLLAVVIPERGGQAPAPPNS